MSACRPAAPPADDTLVVAEPESIEGAEATSRGHQVEGLVRSQVDGRSESAMASSWRWEETGLRLRVTLRSNIRTHTGIVVTPSLAAAALRSAVKDVTNLKRYWTLSSVQSVEPDGNDIVIDLKQPTGALIEDLDIPLTFDGAGTGPYREVSGGENEIMMERFDQYYRGRPAIRRVIFRTGMTRRPAWTSLLRGEIDMVTNVPPDTLQFFGSERIELYSFLRRFQYVVVFNHRQQPLADSAVRRALNLAIDRQLIVGRLLAGRGEAATSPMWPYHWAFDPTIPGHRYDPAAAAALLDAGGLPAREAPGGGGRRIRFSFTCLIPQGVLIAERIGLEVQRQLYRIGVDMKLESVPFPVYGTRLLDRDFEAAFVDMRSGPSFGRIYAFWAHPERDTELNFSAYENREAVLLFDTLRRASDEAEIRSASRRLQRVFLDDPPALSLAWSERTRAVSRKFEVRGPAERDPLLSLWQWTPRPDAVDPRNRH